MVIWQLLPTTCFSAHQPTWLPQCHVDSTELASVQGFTRSHREVPSATAPSRCQQCARDPSKGMFQNNRSVSKAVQISIRLSISNRRICFLLKENHWHCVSVSNQPHMPFCKNFSLIITVPSFFFPTNLPLLSSKRRTWSYHWPRITGNEQQRLHHGVGSASEIWKTGIAFLPTS